MDALETGLEGFAPRKEPYRRHQQENSLHKFGLLFMLFGATTIQSTIGRSSANHHYELLVLGFTLFLFGFLLLILSDFDDSGYADGFAPAHNELNRRRWLEVSLWRYGLILMLFGASIAMLLATGKSSSAYSPEHVLVGIALLLFGSLLLVLSELRGFSAIEWFTRQVVGALGKLFEQR